MSNRDLNQEIDSNFGQWWQSKNYWMTQPLPRIMAHAGYKAGYLAALQRLQQPEIHGGLGDK